MAVLCTLVTFCTIGGFMFYSNLATPLKAYAIAKYYTMANGEWSTPSIWSTTSNTGPTCNCTPTCNISVPADIKHKITVTSCANFTISGGVNVEIMSGGDLTVTVSGKFTISGGSNVHVAPGDTLIVNGNLEMSGTSTIDCDGYMVVYGNVKLSGGSTVCGSGKGYYTGSMSGGSGWCFTGTLPIELVSFEAKLNGSKINLGWTTASEINNDYFTVERSANGKDFEIINTQPGAGNSTITLDYLYTDMNPLTGYNYYRLKQTDYDGKFTYSKIEYVNMKHSNEEITMYPNPVRSNEMLYIRHSESEGLSRLEIYSISGRKVFDKSLITQQDLIEIDFGNELPAGIYFVSIANSENKNIFQQKLIVK